MLKLDPGALFELEAEVRERFFNSSERILSDLNRQGKLDDFLKLVGMADLLGDEADNWPKDGIIIVIGDSAVSKEILQGVAKQYGLGKDRFDFQLGYDLAKKYNFKKTQWNWNYSCILVGPMPHSGAAKGDCSSIITAIENQEDGYPPVYRLGTNELKITRTSFKNTLEYLIQNGKIA